MSFVTIISSSPSEGPFPLSRISIADGLWGGAFLPWVTRSDYLLSNDMVLFGTAYPGLFTLNPFQGYNMLCMNNLFLVDGCWTGKTNFKMQCPGELEQLPEQRLSVFQSPGLKQGLNICILVKNCDSLT